MYNKGMKSVLVLHSVRRILRANGGSLSPADIAPLLPKTQAMSTEELGLLCVQEASRQDQKPLFRFDLDLDNPDPLPSEQLYKA